MLFYLPQDLNGAAADVYLDPPVISALEGYRTCMASRGHPVQFPHDAVELAQRSVQDGSTEPSPAERDIAAADSDCQHSSKVLAECLTSLELRTTPWITANATLIDHAGHIIRRSLPRAKAILSGRHG